MHIGNGFFHLTNHVSTEFTNTKLVFYSIYLPIVRSHVATENNSHITRHINVPIISFKNNMVQSWFILSECRINTRGLAF